VKSIEGESTEAKNFDTASNESMSLESGDQPTDAVPTVAEDRTATGSHTDVIETPVSTSEAKPNMNEAVESSDVSIPSTDIFDAGECTAAKIEGPIDTKSGSTDPVTSVSESISEATKAATQVAEVIAPEKEANEPSEVKSSDAASVSSTVVQGSSNSEKVETEVAEEEKPKEVTEPSPEDTRSSDSNEITDSTTEPTAATAPASERISEESNEVKLSDEVEDSMIFEDASDQIPVTESEPLKEETKSLAEPSNNEPTEETNDKLEESKPEDPITEGTADLPANTTTDLDELLNLNHGDFLGEGFNHNPVENATSDSKEATEGKGMDDEEFNRLLESDFSGFGNGLLDTGIGATDGSTTDPIVDITEDLTPSKRSIDEVDGVKESPTNPPLDPPLDPPLPLPLPLPLNPPPRRCPDDVGIFLWYSADSDPDPDCGSFSAGTLEGVCDVDCVGVSDLESGVDADDWSVGGVDLFFLFLFEGLEGGRGASVSLLKDD
ncbi:hypothetical protein WICPIJ_007790, partial [Wickerhamomyces pijperi]